MKFTVFLSATGFFLLMACQKSVSSSVEPSNALPTPIQQRITENVPAKNDEVWEPTAIEDCISKVDVGEPFKYETSFNPFYLRADLDGNKLVDYAVLIKGQTTKTRGVVICKDSKQPFVFGELSKPKTTLTSFENDNFVTDQWEISTREFTKIQFNQLGRKITPNAKGESIWFGFEGGEGVSIYWDGKTFRVVG